MTLNQQRQIARQQREIENNQKHIRMRIGRIENRQRIQTPEPAQIQGNQETHERARTPNPSITAYPGTPHHIQKNTIELIRTLFKNLIVSKWHRIWPRAILLIAAFILIQSRKSFLFLSNSFIFPNEKTVKNFIKEQSYINPSNYTDTSNIENIVNMYRSSHRLVDNDIIVGILAVDAVSLTPHVKIDQRGNIKGLKTHITLDKDDLEQLKQSIQLQEEVISKLKPNTVNYAFVFYFQPLSINLECFTIHIQIASDGKASEEQVEILNSIAAQLKTCNIIVKAFAADGDSGYNSLIKSTTVSWNHDSRPIIDLIEPLFVSDPLHILKRARYRLLSHDLVLMSKNEDHINITVLKEILNLPSVVFDNSRLTKMQDMYPLRLFDVDKMNLLYSLGYIKEVAYFIPFTLLKTALSESISVDTRVDLLEIIAYYLDFYDEMFKNTPMNERANQKGKGKAVLFDNRIIEDLKATCITINSIINAVDGTISLNRIGSNPLEHHFGLMRIRSKFNDDINRLLLSEAQSTILENIEREIIGNLIKKRKSSFGDVISLNGNLYGGNMAPVDNKLVAYSLCKYFGLPVKYIKYKCPKCQSDLAFDIFWDKIKRIVSSRSIRNKRDVINSKDISYSTSAGSYISMRLEGSRNVKVKTESQNPVDLCFDENCCSLHFSQEQ